MDSANWAQLFCTAAQDPSRDCGPQQPPPPPIAHPKQGGQCLVVNASTGFPCAGGWSDSCPVILGSCSDPTSNWAWAGIAGDERTLSNTSPGYAGSVLNIDCDSCTAGTLAKVSSNRGYASAVVFSGGQLQAQACPGMCLSGLSSAPRTRPCKAGEPFSGAQVILVPCGSSDANGWSV